MPEQAGIQPLPVDQFPPVSSEVHSSATEPGRRLELKKKKTQCELCL